MEILRFESNDHLNGFINNKDYEEKRGKVRTFDNREYVKFGSLIEKHGKLWKVGRFFKVLTLILPSICSFTFRKNIRRTWKEFKTGTETTASLYVQRQLEIRNDPVVEPERVVDNPVIEPNRASVIRRALSIVELKELLNKKDRDQEDTRKLIEDVGNLNTEQLSDLVVSFDRLDLGELLELVSLRDKIEFSNVFLDAAKIRIGGALDDGFSFLLVDLSLNQFQALHSFFPFHPFFVNRWLFLNINSQRFFALTQYIFSFPLNEIPVDYLTKYLEAISFNGYCNFEKEDLFKKEEIEQLRVILPKSSQGINLSTISTKTLELFLKFIHACGVFIPEVSSLSKEKMNALIESNKYAASNRWLIGNLLRMIPNVEERKLQFRNFLSIDSFNYLWFFERKINDIKKECKQAEDAFKNAAGGTLERILELSNKYKKLKDNHENQLKDLESAYVDILMTCEDLSDATSKKIFKDLLMILTSTLDKPENTAVIKEKTVALMSASQAIHVLGDHNFEKFGFSRMAIIHAVASNEVQLSKFIELSQERDLAKCLGQFGYSRDTGLNATMRNILNELLKQNKLVPVIEAMDGYNFSSFLIDGLDAQTLKNLLELFVQKALDAKQDHEKNYQMEKIARIFEFLVQQLKSLPNDIAQINDMAEGKRFIECWDKIIQTNLGMAPKALEGIVNGILRGQYKSELNQFNITRLIRYMETLLANNAQLKEKYNQLYVAKLETIR